MQKHKYIKIHIQSLQFPLLVVWRYKRTTVYRQNTNIEENSMNMRASGASELRKFSRFHISMIVSVLMRCFVSESYILRYKHYPLHIQSMQFPHITCGIWRYKRQYIDKTLTLRE